jgi:hypothetical protein
MASSSTERHSVITHTVGAKGTLVLRTVRGSVRVRGTDTTEVRVEARYPGSSDPTADEQALRVTRTDDVLQVEVDDTDSRRISQLARLFGDGRPRVDFDVTMPRTASLRVSGVSADMDVVGLDGAHEIKTVSGDIRMTDLSGSLSLNSVSGDASVTGGDLAVQASTTSGDLAVTGETLYNLQVRTVSGDVRVAGGLDRATNHSLETISGDVELVPTSGVSISMTSVSGSMHAPGLGRPDQSRGRGSLVVGNGAATLSFRTMSGDLNVRRADPSASSPTAAADAPAAAVPPRAQIAPALPPLPPPPFAPVRSTPPARPVAAVLTGFPTPVGVSADLTAAQDTTMTDDSPTTVMPTPVEPIPVESEPSDFATELDVLRALERGEIDVTTASRLLAEKSNA